MQHFGPHISSLSFLHIPSLTPFLPLRCVFVAVSDMAMKHSQEMILPTACREQHSRYNSATDDVYCCWQCGAHCNMNTRTHTEHARGCTQRIPLMHAHTQRWTCEQTRIRIEAWLQVYSCVFPSWVEPTFCMPPSPNCHAGNWPVFSTYTETTSFFQ